MNAEQEKLIERIKKLLRLGRRSDHAGEAEAALAKAKELADAAGIAVEGVDAGEDAARITHERAEVYRISLARRYCHFLLREHFSVRVLGDARGGSGNHGVTEGDMSYYEEDRDGGPLDAAEEKELSDAVDDFAARMKARLREKRRFGYSGWDDPASRILIRQKFDIHATRVTNGINVSRESVDVANLAMMLARLEART